MKVRDNGAKVIIERIPIVVPGTVLDVDINWQPHNQSGSRVTVTLAYTIIF